MPWDQSRPGTNPKYQTREHRAYCAELKAQLKRDGYLVCTAAICVIERETGSRCITNPNGRARDGLHAGHNDDGVTYAGPQHGACNVRDGAVRASRRSHGTSVRAWVI